MELFSFREFLVLANTRNYWKAAEELAVSESSLSRHIKALEQELGVCLFVRTSRSVELSAYGEILLPYAKQFVALEHRLNRQLQEAQERDKNTVVVGTAYYIDDLLAQFHLYNSRVAITSIHYVKETTSELTNLLRLGICELAFVLDPVESNQEFVALPYDTDRYVAVLPRSHRLARRPQIGLHELADDSFVSFKLNSQGDSSIRALCREAGFEPHIGFTADVGSAIAGFVAQGLGVSVLQKKTLAKMHPAGVVAVELEPPSIIHVSLCYRRAQLPSPAAQSLIDFIAEEWPRVRAG